MEVENHVPVDIRTQLHGYDVTRLRPWRDDGAIVETDGTIGFNAIKTLNEMGYVCGSIMVRNGIAKVFVEPDAL